MAPKSSQFLLALLSIMAVSAFVASAVGGWEPIVDLKNPTVIEVAKFAVAKYNKDKPASLAFDHVLKGEKQAVAGTNYRLVILAKDGNILNTYTAVVYYPVGVRPLQLISFVKD